MQLATSVALATRCGALVRMTPDGSFILVINSRDAGATDIRLFALLPDGTLARRPLSVGQTPRRLLDACWAFVDGTWCVLLADWDNVYKWTVLSAAPRVTRFLAVVCAQSLSAAAGRLTMTCGADEHTTVRVYDTDKRLVVTVPVGQPGDIAVAACLSGDGGTVAVVVSNFEDVPRIDVHDAVNGALLWTFLDKRRYGCTTDVCVGPTGGWLVRFASSRAVQVVAYGDSAVQQLALGDDVVSVAAATDVVVALHREQVDVHFTGAAARRALMSAARVAWLAAVVRVPVEQPKRRRLQ